MGHALARYQHEVVGRGVVVLVVEAVGIREVRVLAADGGGALVHLRDEALNRAGDMDGDDVADLVGGAEHSAVQKVAEAHRLALLHLLRGAVGAHALERLGPRRDGVAEGGLAALYGLDGQQHGHLLRDGGGITPLRAAQLIEDAAAAGLGDNGGPAQELRRGRFVRGVGQGGREGGQDERGQQYYRYELNFFHIHLRSVVVS